MEAAVYRSQGGVLYIYNSSQDPGYQLEEAQGLQDTLFDPRTGEESPCLSPRFPRLQSPNSWTGELFDLLFEGSGSGFDG